MNKFCYINIFISLMLMLRLWLTCLIIVTAHALYSITNTAKQLSSLYTLQPSVSYDLNFSLGSESISSGSRLKLQFSNKFDINSSTLTGCKGSTLSSSSPISISCSVSNNVASQNYEVLFTSLFPTTALISFIRIQFAIANPYGASTSETINVNIEDSGTVLRGFGVLYISYTASLMSPCSITTSSPLTTENSTFTFSFTPTRKLMGGSTLMVNMPAWSGTTNSLGSSTLACAGISGTSSPSLTCSLGNVVGGIQTLEITTGLISSSVNIPSQIQVTVSSLKNPWSLQPFTVSMDLMYSGSLTQTCQPSLTVSQPRSLTAFNFVLTNLAISATTSSIRLSFFPSSFFPKPDNRFRLTFPSQVSVSYTGTAFSSNSTQLTVASVSSYTVSFFSLTNPPSSRPFTVSWTMYYVSSGQEYACETKQTTYQATVGAITAITLTPESYQVNQVNPYLIKFTIPHALTAGSFIEVVFPSDLPVQTTANTCLVLGHSCTVDSSQNISITIGSAVAASTQLSLTVNNVRNAIEAKTTDSFKIYTYYDSLYDSLVDKVESGLTVTMIANVLDNATVSPSSQTTYALTSYLIELPLDDPIPVGGSILVIFPASVSPENSQIASASFSTDSCTTQELTANNLELMGCFPVDDLTDSSISFTLTNVRNPPSLKPTPTFKIYMRGPSGSTINYIETGIFVTMTTVTQSGTVSIVPDTYIVGDTVTYTFTIAHTIDIHAVNDYAVVSFPSLMDLPTTLSCTAISGISSIGCLRASPTSLKVTYLSAPSAATISFSLASTTNYLVGDDAISYSLMVYDSEAFQMETKPQINLTYTESILTSVTVNHDDNIAVGEASNITLTISNSFSLYSSLAQSLTELDVVIPSDFTISSSCSVTGGGTCAKFSATTYRVTSVGLSLTNLNLTMTNLILSYFSPSSQTFQLKYTYDSKNVSVQDSGITISTFCTSPCQRCDITPTTCESCLPAPNTFIYFDPVAKQCGTTCVDGKYPDSVNECQPCVSPCSSCLDEVNCTNCVTGTWLYEKQCLLICPDGYFNASDGLCTLCQSPCDTCLTLIQCTSCSTGFYTDYQCVDSESCPAGTYANTSTLVCESCNSPCSNCYQNQNNCTTCLSSYLYYENKCVATCPDGLYPSSIYCFYCVDPCDTCTNSTSCKSCLTDYLYQGQCFAAEDCPTGTYANDTDMKCRTCPTGCTACLNTSFCTDCNSAIYMFFDFFCYTSCPSGTFKQGSTCQQCDSPCATCNTTSTNCLSCIAPQVFYNKTCLDSCPDAKFNSSGICQSCSSICTTCISYSVCDSCNGNKYLSGDSCVTTCPEGSFGDVASHTCLSCLSPCSQCSVTSTNCTKCETPLLEFQNACVGSCPGIYFQVDGSCVTCPNCLNCLDADTCLECNPGYYEYSGICYGSCPSTAPIPDDLTNSCGTCDSVCMTCEGLAKNCTSCFSGTFLHQGACLQECPLGFIEDLVKGLCVEPLIGSVVYFPFSFTFLAFFFVLLASKCLFPSTEMITGTAAIISLCEFASWCLLTFILSVDFTIDDNLLKVGIFVGVAIILLSITLGVVFNIRVFCSYSSDRGLQTWKEFDPKHVYAYRVTVVLSSLTFRFFRFLYSIFYNRQYFCLYIADGERFLTTANRLTFFTIFLNTLPMMGISAFLLYKKQIYDQTFFCCLDTIILGFIASILLTIDSMKEKNHFDKIKESLPFLKYKNMKNEDSMVSDLNSQMEEEDNRRKVRSEIGNEEEKNRIFQKITFLPNLNKFGHLNILEDNQDKDEIESLPQYNEMSRHKQYDPDNSFNKNDDHVVDDLFFQDIEEERRRKEEEEDEERRRREEEEMKKKEEEERRRRLMEEDEQERVNVEFPDLAAIDKVENKNNKGGRKNPLDLLSNAKKVDDRQINDKAMKKLEEMGKKNGIDPNFMKETFGIEKNHNPELLNQIIDKHHHVKRESVKQLFNDNNDPELLQELFNKNSKMDPNKLRDILNDPESAILIMNLADKENGRLSPEMAKQLLDKDSKYTKEFTKKLLSNENGMDEEKLKVLLRDSNAKGKDSPLKALKKIGGENLENQELLNNMLGEDAVLDPENFTRITNDLSITAIKNLFNEKSEHVDIITKKILNNPKLNLKNLSPILEDEELLQELADALGDGDPNLEENLMNLFKNAENIDPEKLKEMLRDETIRKRLLSNPVDPSFLQAILSKDSNADLKILSNTLKEMSMENIQQTFKFDHEKNVDFKNVASLFDKNPKTDPKLVGRMLEPEMVRELYYKGSDPKMLNKLVEKGNDFDESMIKGVYGKKNHFLDTRTDKMLNLEEENDKREEFRSQRDYSLGFQQKNTKNIANMSRTTSGGMMNFLNPIVPRHSKAKLNQISNEIDDEWSIRDEEDDDGEIQEDQEIVEGKRRKKVKGKKSKKKVGDIRHPAEQIYLQRIEAPHEHAIKKANIRKKKKKTQNPGIMDEDNDIFDMDF